LAGVPFNLDLLDVAVEGRTNGLLDAAGARALPLPTARERLSSSSLLLLRSPRSSPADAVAEVVATCEPSSPRARLRPRRRREAILRSSASCLWSEAGCAPSPSLRVGGCSA